MALAAGCAVAGGSPPQPVVVGVDLNLTGSGDEATGVVFGNGLRLALERVGEQGLAGGAGLQLRVRDNRGDAATSAANLAELAADRSVTAVITAGCPRCVIDAAGDLSVPVISLDAVAAVAEPATERRWIFRIGPTAGDNADALSLAMADAGVESVAVLAADDAYGEEGARWIADAAGRDGLRVVVEQRLPPDGQGVAAAVQQVLGWQPAPDLDADPGLGGAGVSQLPVPGEPGQVGPDAVVLWTGAAQAGELAAALRDGGYRGRLFLDMLAADQLFLPAGAAGLQGAALVFTPTPVADQRIGAAPALAARKTWLDTYTARFGTYHLHSSFAADALLSIADAVRRTGAAGGREAVRDRIESVRIDGMTGQIRFTSDQHSGLSAGALVMLTATGERWQ